MSDSKTFDTSSFSSAEAAAATIEALSKSAAVKAESVSAVASTKGTDPYAGLDYFEATQRFYARGWERKDAHDRTFRVSQIVGDQHVRMGQAMVAFIETHESTEKWKLFPRLMEIGEFSYEVMVTDGWILAFDKTLAAKFLAMYAAARKEVDSVGPNEAAEVMLDAAVKLARAAYFASGFAVQEREYHLGTRKIAPSNKTLLEVKEFSEEDIKQKEAFRCFLSSVGHA